jgi:hypothetical protein
MNKSVSFIVLCLVALGLTLTHVSWVAKDNSYLLAVDGREIDVLGHINNSWVRATRDCGGVSQTISRGESYLQIENAIKAYSPAQSASAQIASVWTTGVWTVVEVEFKELLPAVVLLKTTANSPEVVPNAIWSGYTAPWKAAPYIRQHMLKFGQEAPSDLFNCFEPQSISFR